MTTGFGTADEATDAGDAEWTFESCDAGVAHRHLTTSLGRHAFKVSGNGKGLRVRHSAAAMRGIGVHRLTYGAASVELQPDPSANHIVVVQPLRGRISAAGGSIGVVAKPEIPIVLDVGRQYRLHWAERALASKLVIDKQFARAVAADRHGVPESRLTLSFDLGCPTSAHATSVWSRLVSVISTQAEAANSAELSTLTEFHLARSAVAALLDCFPAAVRLDTERRSPQASAASVARAITYIETHAAAPITLRDIADSVALSPRALQIAFRRYRNMSPMEYVRAERLRRAYADLRAADPDSTTVAAIAGRWGYHNPGRFATEFRQAFGRYPREILASE